MKHGIFHLHHCWTHAHTDTHISEFTYVNEWMSKRWQIKNISQIRKLREFIIFFSKTWCDVVGKKFGNLRLLHSQVRRILNGSTCTRVRCGCVVRNNCTPSIFQHSSMYYEHITTVFFRNFNGSLMTVEKLETNESRLSNLTTIKGDVSTRITENRKFSSTNDFILHTKFILRCSFESSSQLAVRC